MLICLFRNDSHTCEMLNVQARHVLTLLGRGPLKKWNKEQMKRKASLKCFYVHDLDVIRLS